MLGGLQLGKKRHAASSAAVAPQGSGQRSRRIARVHSHRVAAIIIAAREKLKPVANLDVDSAVCKGMDRQVSNVFDALGASDGVGFLLKMASFDVEADGTVSEDELRRFEHEGALLVETMTAQVLNYSVVLSLFLTMYVSLLVLHAGREPYDQAESTLKLASTSQSAAAGDAAAFLWPQDPEGFRFVWYCIECVLLSIGTAMCLCALLVAIVRLIALASLPSVVAKCEFVLHTIKGLAFVGLGCAQVVLNLPVSLCAILVRSSAVAFLCGCGVAAVTWLFGFHLISRGDNLYTLRAQIEEARIVIEAERAPGPDEA